MTAGGSELAEGAGRGTGAVAGVGGGAMTMRCGSGGDAGFGEGFAVGVGLAGLTDGAVGAAVVGAASTPVGLGRLA